MQDFITDEEMRRLESGGAPDFISDEEMAQMEQRDQPKRGIFAKVADYLQQGFQVATTPGGVIPGLLQTKKAKEFIGETFVKPPAREAVRPFVSAIQGLRGKEEGVDIPGLGEIKPIAGLTSGQAAMGALDVVSAGTFGGLGKQAATKAGVKLTGPLIRRAERLYASALKPTQALLKKAPDVVKTGLEERIRVSKGGLQKVGTIIEDIGEEIGRVIDQGAATGKTIAREKLLPYLDEMKEYFSNVVGGEQMIKEVDELGKRFVSELKKEIPIEEAQKLKQATQNFVKKFYNREAPIKFEVQKQVARGLKEEIAKEVPEIATLNARDKALIELEQGLERAIARLGNRELIGLSDAMAFGAGVVSGDPIKTGIGLTILKRIIESPAFKSQRAIWYKQLADNVKKAVELGRYPAAIVGSKVLQLLTPENEDRED